VKCFLIQVKIFDLQVWSEKRVVGYSCQQLFSVVSEVIYLTLYLRMVPTYRYLGTVPELPLTWNIPYLLYRNILFKTSAIERPTNVERN